MAIKLMINPSNDPERDFEVCPKNLEGISFSGIKVGDVIKVTHGAEGGWDYRHISEVMEHPTEPEQSYAVAIGYRIGTGLGGCEIGADRNWVLEKVEARTAYELLTHYRHNWAKPEIALRLDPRVIDV